MKEYRIVCTRDTEHADGTKHHYDNVAPWVSHSQLPHYRTFNNKADAMKALSETVRRARVFDKETQERLASGDPDTIGYWQSNIRLQSRNVSKWDG